MTVTAFHCSVKQAKSPLFHIITRAFNGISAATKLTWCFTKYVLTSLAGPNVLLGPVVIYIYTCNTAHYKFIIMKILHLKSLSVNIIVTTTFIQYVKNESGLLY